MTKIEEKYKKNPNLYKISSIWTSFLIYKFKNKSFHILLTITTTTIFLSTF